MAHIITLTLNPALDISADVPEVVAGPKLRCDNVRLDPGGGGINVSRAIRILGGYSTCLIVSGGATGQMLEGLLASEGIRPEIIPMEGAVRQSFAVTEAGTDRQFRFVLPGPALGPDMMDRITRSLHDSAGPGDLVVLSGSLPPGLPVDAFRRIADGVTRSGARTILDTSGPALTAALDGPEAPYDLLRLDGGEGDELAGRALATPQDVVGFARGLIDRRAARAVIIARGAEGSVCVTEEGAWLCRTPDVEVISKVGAGDSFVAATVLAHANGAPWEEAFIRGTAAASSAVSTPATALCTADQVAALAAGCTVTEL
ncbi:1-phosphofructokinase family hexose kinase [Oceanomicrobium pacificus]|uniref:Phosphofructokinase n=1 Tax=Oceanomicrobium pacificus TaxID=2692916 RepID=A0A6B0TU70_9RHOB|nr:1-phosphofructokinase family hexose kinase [Oceanomicrobium pacificus]MXU66329.1 hexose kinase [Oceanomicrobium pacificus]